MIIPYTFKSFKPKFQSFEVVNVHIDDQTLRVASFDLAVNGTVVLQVGDVNHKTASTQVLQVNKSKFVYQPVVRTAVKGVTDAYKKADYEYKYQSALLVTLEGGYYGALSLIAELAILGIQFQVVKDMYVANGRQAKLTDSSKLFYIHVGDNKLIFPLNHLQSKGLSVVQAELYPIGTNLDYILEKKMDEAATQGQSLVGCVELPLTSTWGNTLTVENIINIYL